MCGRYSLTSPVEAIDQLFGLDALGGLVARYNIAPTQSVPAVRVGGDSGIEVALLRWGLVPSWVKQIDPSRPLINARVETVDEKPSFRRALARRRCLIPADGYFEWQGEAGAKQPYYFHAASDAPFAFAGLWESWISPDGEVSESCAIITTAADEVAAPIHHRMPVILDPGHFDSWMDITTPGIEVAKDLCLKGPRFALTVHPVSRIVNDVRRDDAACIEPEEAVAPKLL